MMAAALAYAKYNVDTATAAADAMRNNCFAANVWGERESARVCGTKQSTGKSFCQKTMFAIRLPRDTHRKL